MNETLAIVLVVGIAIVSALVSHFLSRAYSEASVWSALVASFLFQLASYIEGGFVEPFFLVTIVTGTLFALVIALLVGIPFWVYRRRHATQQPTSQS